MSKTQPVTVALRRWSSEDLPLLTQLMGDPASTGHLGGPETREEIVARHERYVLMKDTSREGPMFAITVGPKAQGVGSIGYWQRMWQGQQLWEVRWSLLPEFQGRGIVAAAMRLLLEHARKIGKARFLHAFPAADNVWANGVCRDSGFELLGEVEFEVGPGHSRRRNDWRIDLFAAIG